MTSALFTDAYISMGARSRGCHTDYRNPRLTHLTTQQLGHWGDQAVTGQTVLFDRYATKAVIIADSPLGRQVMGGLNGILHGNMGPCGDVP